MRDRVTGFFIAACLVLAFAVPCSAQAKDNKKSGSKKSTQAEGRPADVKETPEILTKPKNTSSAPSSGSIILTAPTGEKPPSSDNLVTEKILENKQANPASAASSTKKTEAAANQHQPVISAPTSAGEPKSGAEVIHSVDDVKKKQ